MVFPYRGAAPKVSGMSKCRATSFYFEPGKLMYFKDHVLAARVPASPDAAADDWFLVPITHRQDVARIRESYPHWDGVILSAKRKELKGLTFAGAPNQKDPSWSHLALREAVTDASWVITRHLTSERIIEGRRPYKDGENFARVSYLIYRWNDALNGTGSLETVGGAANLIEDLFPKDILHGENTKAQKKALRKLVENGEVAKVSAAALLLANGLLDLNTAEGQQKFQALLDAPSIPVPVQLPLLVTERLGNLVRISREAGFEVDLVRILADAISPDRLLSGEAAVLVASSQAVPAQLCEALRQSVKTARKAPEGYQSFVKEIRAALTEPSAEDATGTDANTSILGSKTAQQAWELTRDPATLREAVRRGRREDLDWIRALGDDPENPPPDGLDEILEATRVLLGVPRPHPLMRPLHEHLLTVDLLNESLDREHGAVTPRNAGIIEELAQLQHLTLYLGREAPQQRFAALSPSQKSIARHLERGVAAAKPVDSTGSPAELSVILTVDELRENAGFMNNCTYSMHSGSLFRERDRRKILLALTGNFGKGNRKYNVMLLRGGDGVWVFGEINGPKNQISTTERAAVMRGLEPLLAGQSGRETPGRAPVVEVRALPSVARPAERPAAGADRAAPAPELPVLSDTLEDLRTHIEQYIARMVAEPLSDAHHYVYRALLRANSDDLENMRDVCVRLFAVLNRSYRIDLLRSASERSQRFWHQILRETGRN
jgi:hypothetical protein